MLNFFKSIVFTWVALCCSGVHASCDLNMKEVLLLSDHSSQYQVKIEIDNVCSGHVKQKRQIKNIKFSLFQEGKLLSKQSFKSGWWLASKSKFLLLEDENSHLCLKSLNIDLRKGRINSPMGLYLNLKTGINSKLECLTTLSSRSLSSLL